MERKILIFLTGSAIVLLIALIFLVRPFPEVGEQGREINSITMVTDIGGLGDKSFNDAGWNGVQMASKSLGIKADVIQKMEEEDLVVNVSRAAEASDSSHPERPHRRFSADRYIQRCFLFPWDGL